MNRALARKTRRAFFLVLFTPLVLGVIVAWQLNAYQQSVKWVAHTTQVLTTVQEMLLAVTRAESTQRGYLLSGDTSYLDRCSKAKADAIGELAKLQSLTADNKLQQQNVVLLQDIVRHRFRLLDAVVQRKRTEALSASRVADFLREGTSSMQEIWSIARRLTAVETSLLNSRKNTERDTKLGVGVSFAVCILLNLAILIWAYRIIVEYGRARELAAEQILRLNAELEGRVAERTSELELANSNLRRSNDDLAKFAYIASHDLQEPLRTIGSYVGLLSLRYQGKLDDQADRYIKFVVDGAKRMQSLVQDLLIYSRVGTDALKLRPVDMENVLQNVRDNLGLLIQERDATIVSSPLPTLVGDGSKLTQLLMNLIGNAIKFCKPDESPHITINANRQGAEWHFSVADNGIGFDEQYAERIFTIFQRLHGIGAYPGTGMGLAICKRIIEQHGGRIWATSTPGTGSSFWFTLPANAPVRAEVNEHNQKSEKMSSEAVPK